MIQNQSQILKKILQSNFKITTFTHGVNCNVFTPTSIDTELMGFGDVTYNDTPFFSGKLLIPYVIAKRSFNTFTQYDFVKEQQSMWSQQLIPLYSKIYVMEKVDLTEWTVMHVEETEETSNTAGIYYRYLITPSAELINNQTIQEYINEHSSYEEDFENDPNFAPSIDETNLQDEKIDPPPYNYNKV